MEKKNRNTKRIIGAIVILAVLGVVFCFVNAFTGNPISALIASHKIKAYAAATYPALDLELSEVKYNFKYNAYVSHAQSTKSEDTTFLIEYGRGTVSDDYQYEVANHFTTYRRQSKAFDDMVTNIIKKEYPHETTMIIGDLRGDTNKLTPDVPLDLNDMPLQLSLTVYVLSDVRNEERMAELLLELHRLMMSKHIAIDQYTLSLEEPMPEGDKPGSGDTLYLMDFPESKISDDQGKLMADIKSHQAAINESDKK